MHAAAGADADELLHTVVVHQLIHIDGDRRHAHARALHGDRYALVRACVAEDIADGGILLRPLQEILSDKLCTQGVPRQQDTLSDLALFGGNVQ